MQANKKWLSSLLLAVTVLSVSVATTQVRADDTFADMPTQTAESEIFSDNSSEAKSQEVEDEITAKEEEEQKKKEQEIKSIYYYAMDIKFNGSREPSEGQLSISTAPVYGNILQSAIYSEISSEGVAKNGTLPYSTLALYGATSYGSNSYYDYTKLEKSSDIVAGSSADMVAERLENLYKQGVLVSVKEQSGVVGWVKSLWNKFGKFTKSVGVKMVAWSGTSITSIVELFGGLAGGFFRMIGNLLYSLTPPAIINAFTSVSADGNDFEKLAYAFVRVFFGENDEILNQLRLIVGIVLMVMIGTFIIGVIISIVFGNLKEVFQKIRATFSKYIVIVLALYTVMPSSFLWVFSQQALSSTMALQEDTNNNQDSSNILDLKKYAFVTNFDLTGIDYTNITSEQIQQMNALADSRIGNNQELLDYFDDKDLSMVDKITSDETFTANDYIKFIQKASKSSISDSTTVQANQSPQTFWGKSTSLSLHISPFHPLHKYIGSSKSLNGVGVMFDNKQAQGRGTSANNLNQDLFTIDSSRVENAQQVVSGTQNGSGGMTPEDAKGIISGNQIAYNVENYYPVEVRRSNAYSYIYGAKSSGSYTTGNIDNYGFGSGMSLNDSLLEKVGSEKAEGYDEEADGTDIDNQSAYTKQMLQAYNIAIHNRYAGLDSASVDGNNFSNQSTFFVLSSHFTDEGMEIFLENNNFNDSNKGKGGTTTTVKYPRYVAPANSSKTFFSKLSVTIFSSLSSSIVAVGVFFAGLKVSFGNLLLPVWKYFKDMFKGSILSYGMFLMSFLAVVLFRVIAPIVSTGFMTGFTSVASLVESENLFVGFGGLGTSLMLLIVAGLISFAPIPNTKGYTTVISLFLQIPYLLRDSMIEPLQKLENAIIGESVGSADRSADGQRSGSGRAGSLLRSALGFGGTYAMISGLANKLQKGNDNEGNESEETQEETQNEVLDGNENLGADETLTADDLPSGEPLEVGETDGTGAETGDSPEVGKKPQGFKSSKVKGVGLVRKGAGKIVRNSAKGVKKIGKGTIKAISSKPMKKVLKAGLTTAVVTTPYVLPLYLTGKAIKHTVGRTAVGRKLQANAGKIVDNIKSGATNLAVKGESAVETGKVAGQKIGETYNAIQNFVTDNEYRANVVETTKANVSEVVQTGKETVQGKVQSAKTVISNLPQTASDFVENVKVTSKQIDGEQKYQATRLAHQSIANQKDSYSKALTLVSSGNYKEVANLDVNPQNLTTNQVEQITRLKTVIESDIMVEKNIDFMVAKKVANTHNIKYGSVVDGVEMNTETIKQHYQTEFEKLKADKVAKAKSDGLFKADEVVKEFEQSYRERVQEVASDKQEQLGKRVSFLGIKSKRLTKAYDLLSRKNKGE